MLQICTDAKKYNSPRNNVIFICRKEIDELQKVGKDFDSK